MSQQAAREKMQADYNSNLEMVIKIVHQKHNVSESQVATSIRYFKDDANVKEAMEIMTAAVHGEAAPPERPKPLGRGKGRRRGGGGRT